MNVSNKGDVFIVIAPPHAESARMLVSKYLDAVRSTTPADPAHPVLVPGDRAHAACQQARQKGIYLDDGLWEDLQTLATAS